MGNKKIYKYLEIIDLRTASVIERLNIDYLSKKQLSLLLEDEITNENFDVRYEEYTIKCDEIFDPYYNTLKTYLEKWN